MPRLIGRQSNNSVYAGLFLVIAIAAIGSLEYFGVIDTIPGFGWNHRLGDQSQLQP